MRGNQQTTHETPQSSFAMTILPGAAPARTRKVRAHKVAQPPTEIAQPPVEFAQPPIESAAPPAADDLAAPPPAGSTPAPFSPPPAQPTPPPAHLSPPPAHLTPPPALFSPVPPPADHTPPPAPVQYAPPPPPPPAQFAPPPPPGAQYAPPPPPAAQYAPPPPPPRQFAPLSTADRFGTVSPPAPAEPAAPGWYPVGEPAPSPAPGPGYPMSYPTSPGYPPQPLYAERPDATAFPAAPEVAWVPQHAAPGGYAPSTGRSTASKVLIGLAITVVGFVVIGILAAIAIPVFLNQRTKPANRNVLLPATLVNQQRMPSSFLTQTDGSPITVLRQAIPGVTETNAAYYGQDGQPLFAVSVGKLQHRATAADAKSFFSSHTISFAPMGSGPFGGWMECGNSVSSNTTYTTCASLDDAAVVVVVAADTTPSQLAVLSRQVIGSVEQKG